MITIYRSKVDAWLMVMVFGPLVWVIAEGVFSAEYEAFYFIVPIVLLILILFSKIKYIISNDQLNIKGGLFNVNVAIKDIKSIHKTYNPLSAPALSLNRLEIRYGNNFDYLLISPKQREKFIHDLLAINPDIEVKL